MNLHRNAKENIPGTKISYIPPDTTHLHFINKNHFYFTSSYNLQNLKRNKWTNSKNQRQTRSHENKRPVARAGRDEVKRVRGTGASAASGGHGDATLRRHRDCGPQRGSPLHNGRRSRQTRHGGHFLWGVNVQKRCCAPEANITLYVNNTLFIFILFY